MVPSFPTKALMAAERCKGFLSSSFCKHIHIVVVVSFEQTVGLKERCQLSCVSLNHI